MYGSAEEGHRAAIGTVVMRYNQLQLTVRGNQNPISRVFDPTLPFTLLAPAYCLDIIYHSDLRALFRGDPQS
jgi:hypothetical protein